MFQRVNQVTNKMTVHLVQDSTSNFAEVHKDEYAPCNHLWKESLHGPHICMTGDQNNNQMEGLNGGMLQMREIMVHGLKTED